MAAMTLAEKKTLHAAYVTAETKVLLGQSYSIGGKNFTRANLREIREERVRLGREIDAEERGGIRIRRVVPSE